MRTAKRENPAPTEQRKRVSLLFIDIVGSTSLAERLDPERLQELLDAFFQACATSVGEHGGQVEKFIGDAVLAVFGVPVTHEDDALRAVLAAQSAMASLQGLAADEPLTARAGVAEGEVVVTVAPDGGFRVLGSPVNTASRLQSAAGAGQILVDEGTARQVRRRIPLTPFGDLRLRGLSAAVPTWLVAAPASGAGAGQAADPHQLLARSPAAPAFVGREYELALLTEAFQETIGSGRCRHSAVLGDAGAGASRLVKEFAESVGASATAGPQLLVGRCRPSGWGPAYQPIADILAGLPGGREQVAELLAHESSATEILLRLSALTGYGAQDRTVPFGVDEVAWAIQMLLAAIARRGPLVLVLEDLHWAESALLDLVQRLPATLLAAPVHLVTTARPELLRRRPAWAEQQGHARLELGPLSGTDQRTLVRNVATALGVRPARARDAHRHVLDAAEGNPLFIELMMEMIAAGHPASAVHPSMTALLSARIDRLRAEQRELLQKASVIGTGFTDRHLDVLEAGAEQDALLDELVDQRLLVAGGRAGHYRFAQSSLRETAYAMVPKRRREIWHLALARWHADRDGTPDAAAGHSDELEAARHLEAATLLGADVRPRDPEIARRAATASRMLRQSGIRALNCRDLTVAAGLLQRALRLASGGPPAECARLALLLSDARLGLWERLPAFAALDAVSEDGPAREPLVCGVQRLLLAVRFGMAPEHSAQAATARVSRMLRAAPRDHLAWSRLHQVRSHLHQAQGRYAAAENALEAALVRARCLPAEQWLAYEGQRLSGALCELSQWSPLPVPLALARCDEFADGVQDDRALLLPVLLAKARLHALAGDLDRAHREARLARRYCREFGLVLATAATDQVRGIIASYEGRHARAERCFGAAARRMRLAGGTTAEAGMVVYQAAELLSQGRTEHASRRLAGAESMLGSRREARTRLLAQVLRARIESVLGDRETAVERAETAARAVRETTDDPCLRGDVWWSTARVLHAAGRHRRAELFVVRAARAYQDKGAALPLRQLLVWQEAARRTGAAGGGR